MDCFTSFAMTKPLNLMTLDRYARIVGNSDLVIYANKLKN